MAKRQYFARPLKDRFPTESQKVTQLSAFTLLTRDRLPEPAGNHRPARATGRRHEKMLKTSKTQRFLRHKVLPGHEHHGSVQRVEKEGTSRLVTFRDGTVTRFNTPEFKEKFNEALAKQGYRHAVQSIRISRNGRATATIGGAKKGIDKEYETVARCNAALKKIYKQF